MAWGQCATTSRPSVLPLSFSATTDGFRYIAIAFLTMLLSPYSPLPPLPLPLPQPLTSDPSLSVPLISPATALHGSPLFPSHITTALFPTVYAKAGLLPESDASPPPVATSR